MSVTRITDSGQCFIIAEAGVNHNGDLTLAKELVDRGAMAGADAIKFQTFNTNSLLSPGTDKLPYQQERASGQKQADMLQALEFDRSEFLELREYCLNADVELLSTPYGTGSVDLLAGLGMNRLKIASADLVNKPLLQSAAKSVDSIIISTGMADMAEIARSIGWLQDINNCDVTILHCVSAYPAEFADVDMQFMKTLDSAFDAPVGYSDHTLGTEAAVMAVSLGATVIEKHLTLDSGMEGPDHAASLEPDIFDRMVTQIRNVEDASGNQYKQISETEQQNARLMRQSLHIKTAVRSGERLSASDLCIARPNDGFEPAAMADLVGRTVAHDLSPGDPINENDLV